MCCLSQSSEDENKIKGKTKFIQMPKSLIEFFIYFWGFFFYFGSVLEGMSLFPFVQAVLSICRKYHWWLQLPSQHSRFSSDSLTDQQLHKSVDSFFQNGSVGQALHAGSEKYMTKQEDSAFQDSGGNRTPIILSACLIPPKSPLLKTDMSGVWGWVRKHHRVLREKILENKSKRKSRSRVRKGKDIFKQIYSVCGIIRGKINQ